MATSRKGTKRTGTPTRKRPASSSTKRGSVGATGPARRRRPSRRGPLKKHEPFRRALLDKQRALIQVYESTRGDTRAPSLDGTEDYIDYAVSSYDRDFMLSLTEMERRQLQLVEAALQRLGRGEYGHCLHCDREIPAKRLQVEPWARYCVGCQELDERGLLEEGSTEVDESDEDGDSDDEGEDEGDDEGELESDDDDDEEDEDEI